MIKLHFYLAVCFLLFPGSQTAWAESEVELPPRWRNSLGMEFVLIPGGPFRYDYKPPAFSDPATPSVIVFISQPYYLQTTEVTQKQWQALMPTNIRQLCQQQTYRERCDEFVIEGDNYPISEMNVKEVALFLDKLNAREPVHYRLPKEPEWEKAALAGEWHVRYWWRDDESLVHKYANCSALGDDYPWFFWLPKDGYIDVAPVKSFPPNPYGLYDMFGNVSELLWHQGNVWEVLRLRDGELFKEDIQKYIQKMTDVPRGIKKQNPDRAAAGPSYSTPAKWCNSTEGASLGYDDSEGPFRKIEGNTSVGFRLLLEAESVREHLRAKGQQR